MTAQTYFQQDPEREAFYRIFYQTCRRFNVTWSSASPEVKAFGFDSSPKGGANASERDRFYLNSA